MIDTTSDPYSIWNNITSGSSCNKNENLLGSFFRLDDLLP